MTWKHLSIGLAVLCIWLAWRDCRRPAVKKPTVVECERVLEADAQSSTSRVRERDTNDVEPAPMTAPAEPSDGLSMNGFRVPGWAMRLLPQPGENLLAYRDRIVPLAQMAIAPHRARVGRGRDDFAKAANLTAQQRTELDATVQDAASQIQDKLLGAALSGDFSPKTFKPMTGVGIARDALDLVDKANKRFVGTLGEDQRSALATHPFTSAITWCSRPGGRMPSVTRTRELPATGAPLIAYSPRSDVCPGSVRCCSSTGGSIRPTCGGPSPSRASPAASGCARC